MMIAEQLGWHRLILAVMFAVSTSATLGCAQRGSNKQTFWLGAGVEWRRESQNNVPEVQALYFRGGTAWKWTSTLRVGVLGGIGGAFSWRRVSDQPSKQIAGAGADVSLVLMWQPFHQVVDNPLKHFLIHVGPAASIWYLDAEHDYTHVEIHSTVGMGFASDNLYVSLDLAQLENRDEGGPRFTSHPRLSMLYGWRY